MQRLGRSHQPIRSLRPRRSSLAMLAVALLAAVSACGEPAGPIAAASPEVAIRIGAFNFTESEILAEMYAQVLEDRGFPVTRYGPLGSREVVEPALELGLIDLVPEYAGTLLQFVSLGEAMASSDTKWTMDRLRSALLARGLVALEPSEAQDRNAFVVRRDFAREHGVRSISDLAALERHLTFGGPAECPERYFCLGGLRERYGLEFDTFIALPIGRVVADALVIGEIDVGLLFSTDPALSDPGLYTLVDDRSLQPAENVIPVMHGDALQRWGGGAAAILDEVSGELTTSDLAHLNAAVDYEGLEPSVAVRIWLEERELVDRSS